MKSSLLFKQLQIMYKRERQQGVKVYFRNCLKYAKIAYFISPAPSNSLYQYAKQIYGLQHQKIHLFHKGKMVSHTDDIELQENAIIHIVYLQGLKKDKIKIQIKQTKTSLPPQMFEISANMRVKQFINSQLCEVYGVKSEDIFLVHLGKQLSLDCTFREEQVEDGAELLCFDFHNNPQTHKNNNILKEEQTYVIKLPIKQLQAPSPPKDIYPHQKFQIRVPAGLQTSNSLNLIFDSKIKHSSSIGNIDLDPSEVIPQQDSHFSLDLNKNTSSQSQIVAKDGRGEGLNESRFSEKLKGHNQEQQEEFQKVRIQQKQELDEAKLCGGDFIYAGNVNCLNSNNVMHDILNDYTHKIIDLSKKAGRSRIN